MRGISKRTAFALFGLLGLLVTSGALLGSSYVIQQSILYPFRSTVELQDDFIGGFPVSTSIGELSWSSTGGTITYIAPEASRPGIVRRDTTAAAATVTTLQLNSATRALLASETFSDTYVIRLNTNDANTQVRIGVQGSTAGNPDANGIYLEKLDADTNWFCVSRAAAAQTRTDSGVAITTSFFTVSMTKNSGGVQFAINNANVCSLITTNVPTAAVFPIIQIVNSAAAAKTIDTDYFQLRITGLAR